MALDKVIDSAKLDTDLTTIANAIREKGGTSENLAFPNGFVEAVNAIETGGSTGENKLAMLVSNTLEEITAKDLEGVTSIEQYAFYYKSRLNKITIPDSVKSIGATAFSRSGLTEITIPQTVVTFTDSDVFRYCSSLTKAVILAKTSIIPYYCFGNCSKLTDVTLNDSITNLSTCCFMSCSALETIQLPSALKTIAQSVFSNCKNLKSLKMPNTVTEIGNSAFQNCSSLAEIVISSGVSGINSSVFQGCTLLNKLVLRKSDGVCTIPNVNVFFGTPLYSNGTGGRVYVPQALIETYQQATNWSTLYAAGTCNFVAIEGSEYE